MHTHFAVVRVELIPIWVIESSRNIPQPGQFWTVLSGCPVDCFFLPTQNRAHKNREGTTTAKVAARVTSFIEGTTTASTSVASNGEGILEANPTIIDFEWTTADGKELPLLTDDETEDNSDTQKTHSDVTVDAVSDQAESSPKSTSDVLQQKITDDDEAVEMRSTARVETPPPLPPGEEQPLLPLTDSASTGK